MRVTPLTTKNTWIKAKVEDGLTRLQWAVAENRFRTVGLLLEDGANIEAEDSNGATPLQWAILLGHTQTVQVLLQHGAKISWLLKSLFSEQVYIQTDILKLLLYSAVEECPDTAHYILLKLIRQIEKFAVKNDIAPYHAAKDVPVIYTQILQQRMNQELEGDKGYYIALLCKAAYSGAINTVSLLLSIHPTLVTAQDKDDRTIMHRLAICLQKIQAERQDATQEATKSWLAYSYENAIAAMPHLVRQGGDMDQRDKAGNTPRTLLANIGLADTFDHASPVNRVCP
jgi:ankyrin repeat protein